MNDLNPALPSPGLPPPLGVAADMKPAWRDVDLSFDEAADVLIRAHKEDGRARDLPVLDLRTWGFRAERERLAMQPLMRHETPHVIRNNALMNACGRLGAPGEFVRDRLTAPLQLAVLNYLLASSERPISATLRLRGDEVSALVSDKYAPLDSEELVDTLRQALVRHDLLGQVRVRAIATGLVDALRLVLPSEEQAVRVGDISALGLDVSTSSFGRSAVHVRGIVWRLVCTNGLRLPERFGSFSFRHVGDVQRLRDGLADAVPTVVVHARGLMQRWQRSISVFVENVAEQIAALQELTIAERGRVERELGGGDRKLLPEQTSVFDFVNAITAAAHESEPARRLELEALGGSVLTRRVAA